MTRLSPKKLRRGADQASRTGRRDRTRKLLERLAHQQRPSDEQETPHPRQKDRP
jgi:hypothetical protein